MFRRPALALLAASIAASTVVASGATFTASTSATATISASTWTTRSVTLSAPGNVVRGVVALTATTTGSGIVSVRIEQRVSGTDRWNVICTDPTAPYSCSWSTGTAADDYELQAVALDAAGAVLAVSPLLDLIVDNQAPAVTMLDPGSPLRGTVVLNATASDDLSGMRSVAIQYAPAGTTNWVTVCTDLVAPWSCALDTTPLPNAQIDLRAVATDIAGNVTISTTVKNRVVDNTVSSVSLADPGQYLRGTVTLQAFANASTITSVRIERAPAGSNSWTTICTDTTAPYSCAWDTTGVADGLYDLRAVMVEPTKTTTSTVLASRQVDNTAVRGYDIAARNGGAIVGRIDVGDSITYTFTDTILPSTILTGWAGGAQAVTVRFRDGALVGTGGNDDVLDVWTSSALTTPVRLGSVALRGDYLKKGKTTLFQATMTASTTTVNGQPASAVTVRLDALLSGGGLTTSTNGGAMVWSPAAGVTDLAGNPCSTAPVTQLAPAGRGF